MRDILTVGNVLGRLLTVFSLTYLVPIGSALSVLILFTTQFWRK